MFAASPDQERRGRQPCRQDRVFASVPSRFGLPSMEASPALPPTGLAHADPQTFHRNLARHCRARASGGACGRRRCRRATLCSASWPSASWPSPSGRHAAAPAAAARAISSAEAWLCVGAGPLALEPTGTALRLGLGLLGRRASGLALCAGDLGAARRHMGIRAGALGALKPQPENGRRDETQATQSRPSCLAL